MLGEEVAKVADVDPAVPTRSRVRFELPPPDPVGDCLLRHVAVGGNIACGKYWLDRHRFRLSF